MRFPRIISLAAFGLLAVAGSAYAQDPPAPPKPPVTAKPLPKVDISKLKFMEGCWSGRNPGEKDGVVEENWSSLSENLLLSTTRYLKKNLATAWESSRIEVTDSGVVFAARSSGRAEEDVYLMKTLVDGYVLFENPLRTFPKRIMYRMASDGALIPRNEGDGPSVEVRFHRVKCPGSDIKLRPDSY